MEKEEILSDDEENTLNMDTNKKEKISKYNKLISEVDPLLLEKWKEEQNNLKLKLIEKDIKELKDYKLIGGMDISASKNDRNKAIVGFCVINSSDLSILYEAYDFVDMPLPYVPGFLAFREVEYLVNLFKTLKDSSLIPDVILVDGNGIWHNNGFGLASHLGVLLDIPTIGCAKTVFSVENINKKTVNEESILKNHKAGDYFIVKGESGKEYGAVLRGTDDSKIPIYISVGNKISLNSSVEIVKKFTKYRIPEPIRVSDLTTREILREYERLKYNKFDIEKFLKSYKRSIYTFSKK